jgi:glycosyltransferase involved in cell wall biosynthesis
MTDPLISVIVTNYNHSKYIEKSVESVLKQTYPNIETIIVDDCSTDGSKEVIEKIAKENPGKIRTIFLKENKGKWFALNTAIAQANGSLIALNDADDACHPERLKRQYEVMKNTKSFHNLCGFVHCFSEEEMNNCIVKPVELPDSVKDSKILLPQEVTLLVYKGKNTPGINHYYLGNYEAHGASCLFYKQHWEFGMKFLPGNLGLRCQKAEDSDFNTKMTLLLQKTTILQEPLYYYRRNTSTNNAWLEGL